MEIVDEVIYMILCRYYICGGVYLAEGLSILCLVPNVECMGNLYVVMFSYIAGTFVCRPEKGENTPPQSLLS